MKLCNFAKKFIATGIILLLLLSFNFSTNVSAELDIVQDDGVAFDDFRDDKGIEDPVDCSLSNGVITLAEGNPNVLFDQKETPGKIEAWEIKEWNVKLNGGGLLDFLGNYVSPDSPLIPKVDFENADYTAIEADDGDTVVTVTQIIAEGEFAYYPMHQFKFKTDYTNRDDVGKIQIEWSFGPYKDNDIYNLDKLTLFAWNYDTLIPRWEDIDSVDYIQGIDNFSIGSDEDSMFISDDGYVDILVVGTPKEKDHRARIATDYVKLIVTLRQGFFPKGTVTSIKIEPDDRYGWESLIWTGSKPSTYTNIKIRVLDEAGDRIDTLDGNTDGFTTSPIDLSSLDINAYPIIRLEATLKSTSLSYSPRLYSWGVMWQTQNGFKDSFSNIYRIEDTYGVKIENGDVKISKFHTDWEIFGKNPANTRSYIGPEAKSSDAKIYWISDIDSNISGGFRSPVVSNGAVYVSSKENKIFAFNLIADNPWDDEKDLFQIPFDSSQDNYYVESSLAIRNGLVVFGESSLGTKTNKIYALNASKLSEEIWKYPPKPDDPDDPDENDDIICFSASPTIVDDRVFITTCNGRFRDPITSYIFNQFNNKLREIGALIGIPLELFNTDKLYALDLNSGIPIWNPVRLPASSYSTPAVDNGLIFVGCDNLDGPSFFCFDENSGEKIWNASIGLVGRSSPVVGEINNKKTVFVTGREKEIASFKGIDTVYAFDAETGEMLWNVTFEQNTTSFWPLLMGYGFDSLASLASPMSTPAYHDGTLYVLSQPGMLFALNVNNNGEEKWSFDINEGGSLLDSFLPSFNCASPVVVDKTVYVVSENSHIFALDTTNQGSVEWEYKIEDPRYGDPPNNLLFASPVITDRLLIASTSEERGLTYEGRVYVIGDYEENLEGQIVSIPIHVQKGKWWNKFDADFKNTTDNTITFAILDENGNPFSGMSNLNGNNNDISGIKENVIQLSATLKKGNTSEADPVLKRWEINWTTENKKPEFIENSFRAGEGQQGWINLLNIPECSIEVKDVGVGGITSGLDVDSAKFTLEYISEGSDDTETGEFDAECEGESGVKRTKIIAKLSELDIDFVDIENISFSIKDLAGNKNTSETITFKIDSDTPSSKIQNTLDFENKYNTPVRINATGNDDESGIASIALYYKGQNDTEWTQYGSVESPFEWEFSLENSSYYKFCTIAKDLAGNTESFPDDGDVSFHYDQNEPFEPEFKEEYSFNNLPKFRDVDFTDDYELQSVEYRLFEEWILVADNIGSDSYTDEWTISQTHWDRMVEDQRYHMYFRVTDFCGNQYETQFTDETLILIKDLTPPAANINIDISDFAGGGWKESYTLIADIFAEIIEDFESATLEYSYSADKEKWSDWEQYGDNITDDPFEWEFKAKEGSGYYKFKIKIWEDAGSFTESKEKTVSITLFPTVSLLLMIVLVAILILATFFIMKKIRKKKE